MKNAFLLLLTVFVFTASAQNKHLVLKLSPLAAFNVQLPVIEGGIEFKLKNRITWYNEIGIKYAHSLIEHTADSNMIPSKGLKLKSEFRYYLNPVKATHFTGAYVAINLFYTTDQHTRLSYYIPAGSTNTYTDAFGVKKKTYGLHLIYGFQSSFAKHWLFDFYTGAGIKLRDISCIQKEYDSVTDGISGPLDPKIYRIGEKADAKGGFTVAPSLQLGIRIGYLF